MPLGHRFAFSSGIMATPPTVLADSSTAVAPIVSSVPPPGTAKFPVFPLLVAVVVGAVISALGIGAVVYYLARTGRFSIQEGAAHKVEAVGPGTTHLMALEPLLVNLSDVGGSSYLRVALTLRIADVLEGKGSKTKEENPKDDKVASDAVATVRDTTLMVLGRQTADGLLAINGKEHLKDELKKAFAEHNADLKVMDVFFTDFLVQR
jgi:flagellar FliL protein